MTSPGTVTLRRRTRIPCATPEDVTLAVANAARLGVGLGAVCADVVESLNAILKRAYNNHTARRGGNAGGYGIGTGGGCGFASLGVVVFEIPPSVPTPWGTTYGPMHYGQTHAPKFPALFLFVPSPSSCFTTSWTKTC